jgi:hypothetical protein
MGENCTELTTTCSNDTDHVVPCNDGIVSVYTRTCWADNNHKVGWI